MSQKYQATHAYEPIKDEEGEVDDAIEGEVDVDVEGRTAEVVVATDAADVKPRFAKSLFSNSRARYIWSAQCLILVAFVFLSVFTYELDGGMSAYWDSPGAESRILFVGDSFTFYNGGMDAAVKNLAATGTPQRILVCDAATKGGSPLETLWGLSYVQEAIMYGKPHTYLEEYDPPSPTLKYDYVVIQDDIPEYKGKLSSFFKYARLFDQRIRSVGSTPVLFMAWNYTRLSWVTQNEIADAHRSISAELGIAVAPVGLAMQRSLAARPSMAMLGGDHEHETVHGTYLASNVILSTLFTEDDVSAFDASAVYRPSGVSEEEATYLRGIARETVVAWRNETERR